MSRSVPGSVRSLESSREIPVTQLDRLTKRVARELRSCPFQGWGVLLQWIGERVRVQWAPKPKEVTQYGPAGEQNCLWWPRDAFATEQGVRQSLQMWIDATATARAAAAAAEATTLVATNESLKAILEGDESLKVVLESEPK